MSQHVKTLYGVALLLGCLSISLVLISQWSGQVAMVEPQTQVAQVSEAAPIVAKSPWSDIEADMGLHEFPLLNAAGGPGALWPIRALVSMGVPRGDATPSWWQPTNQALKSSAYWNSATPWFVIWPGTAHTATNVRVKISAITLYFLSKSTGRWQRIAIGNPQWSKNQGFGNQFGAGGAVNVRTEPDGKPSFKLDASFHPVHGGLNSIAITGSDVAAAFNQVTSELVLDDPSGVDDRAQAQLMVQAGVDYYPTTTSRVSPDFDPTYTVPAAGSGRFGIVSSTPRQHYIATIDPPGNTNNPKSVFQQNGGVVAIPRVQFEANMPPLQTTPGIDGVGDFNHDGLVNSVDLSLMISAWNQNNATYDLNRDGVVNSLDYVIMVQNWTP